jgi:hypothetical protein
MVSFGRFFAGFRPDFCDGEHRPAAAATGAKPDENQKSNRNNEKGEDESTGQLARWISRRIDRAAQMNNKAPSVVVTAADSSEYRTAWAP